MESIGSILRKHRLERSLSLEEAHQATKITLQNLAALEDDQFDSFPNRVYARAFLRDYANYLGLDSGALLERYEAEWGPKDDLPIGAYYKHPRSRAVWWLLGLAIVTAAAAAAFFTLNYPPICTARSQAYSWARTRISSVITKPEPTPEARPAAEPASAPPPEPQPSQPQRKLNLTVTVTGPAWLRVEVDGVKAFEGTLTAGQTRIWAGDRAIRVRTGNAGAVRLNLNGKDLGVMGPPVQIRERVFRAKKAAQ